jgi:hypothetical protein
MITRARLFAAAAVLSLAGIGAAGCEVTPTASSGPGTSTSPSTASESRSARVQIKALTTDLDTVANGTGTNPPGLKQDTLAFDRACQVTIAQA